MATTIIINRYTGERRIEETTEVVTEASFDSSKALADLIVKWGMETGEIDRIVSQS